MTRARLGLIARTLSVLSAGLLLPVTANAATVSYTANSIIGPSILSSFDISGVMPSGHVVTGASITARFQDKLNEHYFFQTQWTGSGNDYNFVYLNPAETAEMTVGAETFQASSAYTYLRYYAWSDRYNDYYDVVDGYWGDFSISQFLAQSAIDTLNATGQLAFSISAVVGDFKFIDTTLSFETTPQVAPVPLPAALPLFGTALGGLGIVSWLRRRKTVLPAI